MYVQSKRAKHIMFNTIFKKRFEKSEIGIFLNILIIQITCFLLAKIILLLCKEKISFYITEIINIIIVRPTRILFNNNINSSNLSSLTFIKRLHERNNRH